MADETRCPVCGRPSKGGTLLPRESPCGGCHAEYDAAITAGKSEGEAKQLAKNAHEARELVLFKARVRRNYERNAAGKSAVDGTTALRDFTDAKGRTYTVADFKARAQAKLDEMDAREAVSP